MPSSVPSPTFTHFFRTIVAPHSASEPASSCSAAAARCENTPEETESDAMDPIAESYVKLVLSVGQLDADYVDAYYGPAGLARRGRGRDDLRPPASGADERRSDRAARRIPKPGRRGGLEALRHTYLSTQLGSVAARLRMLAGETLSFDEESKALYDAVAPTHDEDHFQRILDELEPLLPGEGSLIERWSAFRSAFVIPPTGWTTSSGWRSTPARSARARTSTLRRERDVQARVRHRQELERLQLVPGRLREPDPDQHRPADLHRSCDRPGLPRGLPRPPRVQHAAGKGTWCATAVGSSSPSTRCSARNR